MRNDNSHDSTMADTSALLVELLSDPDDPNFSATKALVRHLRQEADLSQQKADRLNEQARMLSVQFGVTQAAQDQYGESGRVVASKALSLLHNEVCGFRLVSFV
mmetsp:Transcript_3642/g.9668  ORF Transcript_3642/g.9668 Transcript_3642/m.9668 type:complete len:104 (+) Transcript_3642:173-484(+)